MKIVIFVLLSLVAVAIDAHAQQTANFALSWTDNSTNETGFRVERRLGTAGATSIVGTVAPNVVNFTDTVANDPGNTQYCFRVEAFNSAGSGFSPLACATTPVIVIPPPAPGGVSVTVTVTVVVP